MFSLIGARILLIRWPDLYADKPYSALSDYKNSFLEVAPIITWKGWLQASLDALCLLLMVVLAQDTIWLLCNTFRWILPFYSGVANFSNYYVRFPQNIVGLMLFGLLSYGKWRLGVAYFNWKTLAIFILIACFTATVFVLAPGQAWTDWVFAVNHNFPFQVVLGSFLISGVGYKALIALAFLSLLQKPQKASVKTTDSISSIDR